MRRKAVAAIGVACAMVLATAACGNDDDTTADKGSGEPIRLGYLTSFSGANSASFTTGFDAAQARLELYAAEKGMCADRSFELVRGDDASSTQGALTATQKLVQQDKTYAVLDVSSFFFGAAQWVTTTGKSTPVIGGAFDGAPQWEKHPESNLFPFFPVTDLQNTYTLVGDQLKALGTKKVAGIAFNSPSSQASLRLTLKSAEAAGLQRAYTNDSVPFGSKDVGPLVLGVMKSGADALYLAITPDTGLAVVAGLRQAGWKGRVLTAAGYGDLLASPQAVQLAQGVAFITLWAPTELDTEATKRQAAALKQHAGLTTGVPGFAQSMGWLAADLFLHGLEKAGCDASQEDFIQKLRSDNTWDAGGLYPGAVDFSKVRPEEICGWFSVLEGKAFKPLSKEPVCGKKI